MTQRVKAGDTVTATVTPLGDNEGPKPFEIKGEVYMDPFGDVLMVGAFRLEEENVTLTDHQPAPEPEWKPGTLVKGTVVVDQTRDTVELEHDVQMMRVTHIDSVGRAFVSAGGDIIDPRHVTDVRPLVVIDPSDEKFDQDSLAEVARTAYMRANDTIEWETVANAIRAHLGLEKSWWLRQS